MSKTVTKVPRILIVGGGYVGLYTALRLQRRLRRDEAAITVIDPQSYMTYQPFLPEAAAGNLSPRHVVVPLRRVLRRVEVLNGRAVRIDHAARTVEFEPNAGPNREIGYDVLVMAAGSVSRTLPVPGLAEWGIGFKTVGEAIHLRNHVLQQLDTADSTTDADERRKALTFVFVGAGFAGVEAIAELEDMARDACALYPSIRPEDLRFHLVEASDRILPEVGPEMGRWALDQLRGRGVEIRLGTRLESAVDQHIRLSDGTAFDAGTLVWTAGVKPSPVVAASDLPTDGKGRVVADEYLRVAGHDDAYAAGDNAAVPDLTAPGEFCAPNAQHAVRQTKVLGDNIVARLRGKEPKPYRHAYVGSVAGLGLHMGVANVYGVKVRGVLAWFLHRTYHLSRVPTVNRKTRVMADWTLSLFFRREFVSLGGLEQPRLPFEMAANPQFEDGRLRRVS
ncbi:NAD(P)/FAD-dependent oxidoreductase [Allonocardiopsis opalescens]|uniref:NADH dehydrogenase n=1 Tax=Allonocardiopsis opalescens TaxID=1144618 RepID=A0A2T0QD34_9ACTN|nr:NAD(P)/FAD-dependent oxidoreductase [Allonocardiopsis opalescens]PRY01864.1 NADH dehydrogenase [Allonocardiopsis opalescens]